MSTTAKVLQVLQMFREGRRRLRAADVMERLGVSSATAYRYLGDLEQVGLIERSAVNEYVLGPTVIELDRQIRENDPLIAAAREVVDGLCERTGATVLLTRLHGRQVVCVHQARGRHGPKDVSYERGRAMPLFRGATSRVILAHLPRPALQDIVRHHRSELAQAGLPTAAEALHAALAPTRSAPVVATAGEVDPDALGWATPLRQGQTLLGSLSVVLSRHWPAQDPRRLADQLLRAALRIEGRLEAGARPLHKKKGTPPA